MVKEKLKEYMRKYSKIYRESEKGKAIIEEHRIEYIKSGKAKKSSDKYYKSEKGKLAIKRGLEIRKDKEKQFNNLNEDKKLELMNELSKRLLNEL